MLTIAIVTFFVIFVVTLYDFVIVILFRILITIIIHLFLYNAVSLLAPTDSLKNKREKIDNQYIKVVHDQYICFVDMNQSHICVLGDNSPNLADVM